MILEIKKGDKLVARKEFLHNGEVKDTRWIVYLYKDFFGLDISQYNLSELYCYPDLSNLKLFSVNIRIEDLIKLRDDKLKSILKD